MWPRPETLDAVWWPGLLAWSGFPARSSVRKNVPSSLFSNTGRRVLKGYLQMLTAL